MFKYHMVFSCTEWLAVKIGELWVGGVKSRICNEVVDESLEKSAFTMYILSMQQFVVNIRDY